LPEEQYILSVQKVAIIPPLALKVTFALHTPIIPALGLMELDAYPDTFFFGRVMCPPTELNRATETHYAVVAIDSLHTATPVQRGIPRSPSRLSHILMLVCEHGDNKCRALQNFCLIEFSQYLNRQCVHHPVRMSECCSQYSGESTPERFTIQAAHNPQQHHDLIPVTNFQQGNQGRHIRCQDVWLQVTY